MRKRGSGGSFPSERRRRDGGGAAQRRGRARRALKWAPSGSTGFKYKDVAGTSDGITGIKVKSGAANKAKALVKGKGGDLDDPVLGNLTLPVTAQLINQPSNVCFEGVFDTQDVIKNEATQFKAKAQ